MRRMPGTKSKAAIQQCLADRQESVYDAEAEAAENERSLQHDVVERQRTGLHPLRESPDVRR